MKRTFEKHITRKSISLDGAWLFVTDPEKTGKERGYHKNIPEAKTVFVPRVWNSELGLLEYEGACWYQKDFFTDGGTLRFVFGSVMSDAEVYLDGELIATHYGAFCEFDAIVTGVCPGKHRLCVRADNTIDEKSVPQRLVDWYNYGGIARSVSVEKLSGICVLSSRLEYTLDDTLTNAEAKLFLEVYNAESTSTSTSLSANIDGFTLFNGTLTLEGAVNARSQEIPSE